MCKPAVDLTAETETNKGKYGGLIYDSIQSIYPIYLTWNKLVRRHFLRYALFYNKNFIRTITASE